MHSAYLSRNTEAYLAIRTDGQLENRFEPFLLPSWEDGPELSGWGATVATYPDGKPAVVEGFAGDGWVVLVGVHPEAPESWRRGMTFAAPASASNAYAMALIDAALNRKRLAQNSALRRQ